MTEKGCDVLIDSGEKEGVKCILRYLFSEIFIFHQQAGNGSTKESTITLLPSITNGEKKNRNITIKVIENLAPAIHQVTSWI